MLRAILFVLGGALLVATLLPMLPSNEKWVRIFDFPRAQIAILLLATTVLFLFFMRRDGAADILMMLALVGAFGWQAYRIFPYTPFASVAVKASSNPDAQSCVRLAVANVLMENRNADALLRILREADPDIVLLVETDDWWDAAMRPLGEAYPHVLRQPQDNHYGMILYSRLPFDAASVEFLVDENIPSVHAQFRLPSGEKFAFYGVHPVPPPLADTEQRDAELLVVGKMAKDSPLPAIVAGDLNDVGWSATTRLFQSIGGLLDPRHGRGFFASYNAKNPAFRWPLDHYFHDPVFTVQELRLLEAFGSDHFPVFVHLCRNPAEKDEQRAPDADAEEKAEADRKIEEGKAAEPDPDEYPKQR